MTCARASGREDARQTVLRVADIPGRGGASATVMYAAGLGISRASPNRRLAWEYLKYMTSGNVQRRRAATGLAIEAILHHASAQSG